MIIRRLLMSCLLALLPVAEVRADILFMENDHEVMGRVFTVVVQGDITAQDHRDLLANGSTTDWKIVVLDSEGGDLDAAMSMGRYFRKMEFDAFVMPGGVCYSACVFLLAAGIDKYPEGSVGIHRPYYRTGDPGQVAEAIRATKDEASSYFEEMNIPVRLAEDMFSIAPSDMRILSTVELRDYRLDIKDYVAAEADTLRSAQTSGVSRETYNAFERDLNYSCKMFSGKPPRLYECMSEVAERYGIPMPPPAAPAQDAAPESGAPPQDKAPAAPRRGDRASMPAAAAAQFQQLPRPRMALE